MNKELSPLEALNDLWYGKKTTETYQTIEKSLKALEIIKKKKVDCFIVIFSQSYIEYNDMCECEQDKLTQEEYNLLKEVLL